MLLKLKKILLVVKKLKKKKYNFFFIKLYKIFISNINYDSENYTSNLEN